MLDGDLSPLFAHLESLRGDAERMCEITELMSALAWDAASAEQALVLFGTLPCPQHPDRADAFRRDTARAIFGAAPAACRSFVEQEQGPPGWHRDLACAWIDSLTTLQSPEEHTDWKYLFQRPDPVVVLAAAERAVATGSSWTLDSLIARAVREPQASFAAGLRQAVRQLSGL